MHVLHPYIWRMPCIGVFFSWQKARIRFLLIDENSEKRIDSIRSIGEDMCSQKISYICVRMIIPNDKASGFSRMTEFYPNVGKSIGKGETYYESRVKRWLSKRV